ncbi:MAG: ion transporter [Clostridiales bacterium]|nr:ion transporter [Clostridiales bacterium]
MKFKNKLFEIIEPSENGSNKLSICYDFFIIISIIASLIPLAFKQDTHLFQIIDIITTVIFIIDYILRLITANLKIKKGAVSYLIYPFTPMAIIDLLSILPSITAVNSGFKALRLLKMFRALRVFKSFKFFRYSKNIDRIVKVLKKESKPLIAVLFMAIFYILFTAFIMFNIEPDTFDNFFQALYWATISLTSVGYGDIYPTTNIGRLFTMMSTLVGIAVIALPSGIITAGYIEILHNEQDENDR